MKIAAALNTRQFTALVRAAAARRHPNAPRDRFLFYFLGKTGLRITEALSLRVSDFFLTDTGGTAFVRVRTLKQKAARHDEVLLDAHAARLCRHYFDKVLPRQLGREVKAYDSPFSSRGRARCFGHAQPMTRRGALFLFRTYARLAALPLEATLHSLRHYRGTMLLRTTGDMEFTRVQLRHRSIRSTQVYQHIDPDSVAEYMKRMAEKEGI
jgi:integrase/recombinase XerD